MDIEGSIDAETHSTEMKWHSALVFSVFILVAICLLMLVAQTAGLVYRLVLWRGKVEDDTPEGATEQTWDEAANGDDPPTMIRHRSTTRGAKTD